MSVKSIRETLYPGVIYAIQAEDGGPVKLGWVTTPDRLPKRVGVLQIGNPGLLRVVWTTPGSQKDESVLHARFRDRHVRGEWFEESVLEELRAGDDEERRLLLLRHNAERRVA